MSWHVCCPGIDETPALTGSSSSIKERGIGEADREEAERNGKRRRKKREKKRGGEREKNGVGDVPITDAPMVKASTPRHKFTSKEQCGACLHCNTTT